MLFRSIPNNLVRMLREVPVPDPIGVGLLRRFRLGRGDEGGVVQLVNGLVHDGRAVEITFLGGSEGETHEEAVGDFARLGVEICVLVRQPSLEYTCG